MSMRLPRHLANNDVTPAGLPPLEGVDSRAALDAAVAHGADATRFVVYLAAGVAAGGGAPIDLIGLAAWRAGALPLRDDGLARIDRITGTEAEAAGAAVLGFDAAGLASFAEHQRGDRWWWPGREETLGYVASVGGFVGLGGAWKVPPRCAVALTEPGAFAILTGDQWWRLDADAWCSRLVLVEDPPALWLDEARGAEADASSPSGRAPSAPGAPTNMPRVLARRTWGDAGAVSLVLPAQTYLAWIHVGVQ